MRVDIDGGKYTYVFEDGRARLLRHGEPSRRDVVGDKVIYCMAAEIAELRQQLAAALAACKLKDEALEYMHREKCDYMMLNKLGNPIHETSYRLATKALAIKPDDSALKAWLGEREIVLRKQVALLRDAIRFFMKAEGDYDLIEAGKKFTKALAATEPRI